MLAICRDYVPINFPHLREAFYPLVVPVLDDVCCCMQLGAGVAGDLEWSSSEIDETLETHEKCVGRIVLSYLEVDLWKVMNGVGNILVELRGGNILTSKGTDVMNNTRLIDQRHGEKFCLIISAFRPNTRQLEVTLFSDQVVPLSILAGDQCRSASMVQENYSLATLGNWNSLEQQKKI